MKITVDKPGYLYKIENKLLFSKVPLRNALFLCKIVPHKDTYEIDLDELETKDIINLEDVPWIISKYVFNSINEPGYILNEGDLIKMGKYILKVRQIKLKKENIMNTMIDNQLKIIKDDEDEDEDISRNLFNPKDVANALKLKSSSLRDDHQNIINVFKVSNKLLLKDNVNDNSHNTDGNGDCNNNNKDRDYLNNGNDISNRNNINEQKPICRICLSDSFQDPNNPMINPCKCSGTMKYLHLVCLQKFIESKIQTRVGDNVTLLSFKSIECDICKTVFPEKIKIKNTSYVIIDLHRPMSNYIIIEGMNNESLELKYVFVLNFKHQNSISIGRASNSDMKLSDISVSRNHAEIILKNNSFQLIDNKSKFGTLINSSHHLSILPNKPLVIQKRQINLKFKMSPKICSILTCYNPKELPYKTYNEYFRVMHKFKKNINELSNILLTETHTVDEYELASDKNQRAFSEKNKTIK